VALEEPTVIWGIRAEGERKILKTGRDECQFTSTSRTERKVKPVEKGLRADKRQMVKIGRNTKWESEKNSQHVR